MSSGLFQSSEAAAAAEFNAKKWVWVADNVEGYLAGWVNAEEQDGAEVIMAQGGEFRKVPFEALFKMNPPKFDRVEDIANLTFLNEASVVHNLRLRYGSGAIYTYSGLFLVAINPYQHLPLYSDAIVHQYRGKRRDENPPHIFAVAERAWVNMGEERENQSILITGESGAGKTESTKKVIQYLAAIATDVHPPPTPGHSRPTTMMSSNSFHTMPSSGLPRSNSVRRGHALTPSMTGGSQLNSKGRLGLLERQILQANPILEAFGNAQTQRNNNSSRFGKFVRVMFAPDGSIAGANIDWYLLEKSRVVYRNEAERSFHVFYQLLAGGGTMKDDLLLNGQVEDYEYLNKSRREIDGVDDREEWKALKAALDLVGLDTSEQFDLFRIVAAILHIGNITITASRSDDAMMPDPSQAERVCHLLGLPIAEFTRAVLRPRALAGREWVTQARTRQQALDELSALCKTLYERSFGALVDRINRALDRPASKSTFIGVLDIAGFEIFDTNGYEQLLINYTNEKLQQFFNHHMFVLEQEEYAREGIRWDYVNFGLDLQPTIDLIESSGNVIGILSCLDEECIMPKATDLTFTNKLNAMWAGPINDDEPYHPGRDTYEPSRFEQGFIVQHYAARVEYRTEGWLDKNKDPLNDNLTRVLAASSDRCVAGLFSDYVELSSGATAALTFGKKRTMKKGAFRTLAQRHKEQLSSLMLQLRATQPHFVRCIVPNTLKRPGRIDVPLVLDQLRCNGVLEGIRIARLGYPNRLPFVEFRQRYEVLTPGIIPKGYMDGREASRRMVNALELDEAIFKIGTSKIFFKAGVLAELEERRDLLLFDIFSRLQAVARMWTARRQMKKILNRAIAIRTIQRNARVYGQLREWPWWQLYTKVRPLLAATRNDEELRKKEMELALAKERAERDKQEKEALGALKLSLETEKRKVEDQLQGERALALEKDSLLERSMERNSALEEEVTALQTHIDLLDSHLDSAMKLQKESEEKRENLRQAFDEAADHLVRLEEEQKHWTGKGDELNGRLTEARQEIEALCLDIDTLEKANENLKQLVTQREEDLVRAKERMDIAVKELQGRIDIELRNRDLIKDKSDTLENDARQAKEQLAELGRTAAEYSNMIQRKEDQITLLNEQLDTLKQERHGSSLEIMELKADLDTLSSQLQTEKQGRANDGTFRVKLQQERDDLRTLLATKTSEETRRNEAEKSKEIELADLRSQYDMMHQELSEVRQSALEGQNKLKLELDVSTREYTSLHHSHKSLLDRERAAQSQLTKTQAQLTDLEKAKRALDSEILVIRTHHHEGQKELAEVSKAKEDLKRQLTISQSKYQDFEDVALQYQRDMENSSRQLETARQQLEAEIAKRTQLEKMASNQKAEIAKLKDRNIKLDKELNKTLTELKNKEWEVKQLVSKQDKTIVEHVHVLEEAKRVTDRQLTEAQLELQRNQSLIRSLQVAKSKISGEVEDLYVKHDRELHAKEGQAKAQQNIATRALADLEKERRARSEADLQIRRLLSELQDVRRTNEELEDRVQATQKAKDSLENELDRLAEETESTLSLAKLQRQYETRITQLRDQLDESEMARSTAVKIREIVERQHADIRQLIMSTSHTDHQFQSKLLQELQLADEALKKEVSPKHSRPSLTNNHVAYTPRKSLVSKGAQQTDQASPARVPDRQVAALKQQVQVLEIQMAASERVRRHLEGSIREMTAELEKSDGSKQSLLQYRTRLMKENTRLAELLHEEAEARRTAEASQVDGLQAMWSKFQKTIADERENFTRLDESRKALLVQQRSAQEEVESQRAQLRDLTKSRKQLQGEVTMLKDQLEVAKTEAANAKKQLQKRQQDDEVTLSTSSAAQAELRAAIEGYKIKEQSLENRLKTAETAKAMAENSEKHVRQMLSDYENAQSDSMANLQKNLKLADQRIRELEGELENQGSLESSELALLRQRLAEELEDEREQRQKDLSESHFTMDQTRKKYQTKLAELSEELQSQRDHISRLREEKRKIQAEYDELQLRFDDEVYNSGGWKKEKERMETKINDLEKAYEASSGAQTEQQSQIVVLHSQVRELRGVLDDAEADRALLQKARRALQAELETIKLDHVDTNKLSSDQEFQRLQLKKQDLERSLEEQEDRVSNAYARMKKAETYANECQIELGKVRVENSELDKLNANLEKQIKELNVRIVDLETRSYANSSRASHPSRRLDELIKQSTGDAKTQSVDNERTWSKVKSYEAQVQVMRDTIDSLQTQEADLQAAKRRAEREAVDSKQRVLGLERELERLHHRLDRPPSTGGTNSRSTITRTHQQPPSNSRK